MLDEHVIADDLHLVTHQGGQHALLLQLLAVLAKWALEQWLPAEADRWRLESSELFTALFEELWQGLIISSSISRADLHSGLCGGTTSGTIEDSQPFLSLRVLTG